MPVEVMVAEQRRQLQKITNFGEYSKFHQTYFETDDQWLRVLSDKLQHERDAGKWQLFGLNAMLGAQLGFEKLEGQEDRHIIRGFVRRPSTDPLHQLSLAGYMAKLILQKEATIQLVDDSEDPNLKSDLRGVRFDMGAGNITQDVSNPKLLRRRANDRLMDSRPICVVDLELSKRLAPIAEIFPGKRADTIHQKEFEREILPSFLQATQGVLKPIPIFRSF